MVTSLFSSSLHSLHRLHEGGVVKELLDLTQAGVHSSNEAELREYLLNAYRENREFGAV